VVERPGVVLTVNLGAETATLPCPDGAGWRVALASVPGIELGDGSLALPSISCAVLVQEPERNV
jgi:hypothetical protein